MSERKPLAWSHSALESFETCAWRHYLTKVTKKVSEPPSEAINWGKVVHKAFENRLGKGTPLPESMKKWEHHAAKFDNFRGTLKVEHQIALTRDLKSTSWFGKDVWVRMVLDVFAKAKTIAGAIDWKTGKNVKEDSAQLELFALAVFHTEPEVDKVKTSFVWLPHDKTTDAVYTRDQVPDLWNSFMPRVTRYEKAFTTDSWPKNPNGLCRSWCPVGKHNCEHCGR